MKKLLFAFLILVFALTACNKNSTMENLAYEKKTVLGFAQLGAESEWRTANTESIKSAAKEAGIELKFDNAQQNQANQIKAIRSFIAQRVDVIAFSPYVRSGWDAVLKEAKDAGIPVIITDRDIDTQDKSLYVTIIGSDFIEEGKRAANWLIENREPLGLKGQLNIVELQGTAGSTPTVDRKKGFESVIEKYPDIRVINSQYADFMRSKGKEVMETFIKTDRDEINVLFAHNDDMALGAIEVMEEAGLQPGKDIIIISIDAVREAFDAMIAGKLNCSVECNPLLGPDLMKAVKNIMDGKPIPQRIITQERVFSQENAKAELQGRKY